MDNAIKVHYIYNKDAIWASEAGQKGVITIVSSYDDELSRLYYGISICAPGDNFSKKVGTSLALRRLLHNDYVRYNRPKKYQDMLTAIIFEILCNNSDRLPRWAKESLKDKFDCLSPSFLTSRY